MSGEYLILAPPVLNPSEPPSGPFVLAAGLAARGIGADFMDLSLLFFLRVFEDAGGERGVPPAGKALEYFRSADRYEPQLHRTFSGILSSALRRYSERFPGWRLTLMDAEPPCDRHSPTELREYFESGAETPFSGFWEWALDDVIEGYRQSGILISVSYLSQLPAAVDLHRYLVRRGLDPLTGGSLPRSLEHSGQGFDLVEKAFGRIVTGDGSGLAGDGRPFLSDLSWPGMISGWDYLSSRPVIPFPLSTGCYWDRCLFCPDRGWEHYKVPHETLEGFVAGIPDDLPGGRPVLHFLDSAVPPEALRRASDVCGRAGASFYGFVRPSRDLLADGFLEEMSDRGCLMLQMGVESGSAGLLDRFDKGLDPAVSSRVVRNAAAAGIRTYVYMLLGLPGETDADHALTAGLLDEAGDSVDFLNVSVFNLPCSSELMSRALEFGIEPGDFDAPEHAIRLYSPFMWNGVNVRERAREFLRGDLARRPAVARAIRNTPKWFRGSHMAMMDLPGRRSPG